MQRDLVVDIGIRMRALMQARGLNREQLYNGIRAMGGDISDGTLGRLMGGRGNPTLRAISTVAEYFGMQTWEFLATDSEIAATLVRMSQRVVTAQASDLNSLIPGRPLPTQAPPKRRKAGGS
ncbi:MAG: helix-turn-helix transcriptional regulator [Rhodospirillales bacterium]|nr:helix-turn-helix transcriptional regulator [Rhodospirillales bacterium]